MPSFDGFSSHLLCMKLRCYAAFPSNVAIILKHLHDNPAYEFYNEQWHCCFQFTDTSLDTKHIKINKAQNKNMYT